MKTDDHIEEEAPRELEHPYRFVESLVYGEIADHTFVEECRRLGLRPEEAIRAPLDWLSAGHRTPNGRN